MEMFVEAPRSTGAVYRASGWTRVGATWGRRRSERSQTIRQAEEQHLARPAKSALETKAQPIKCARDRREVDNIDGRTERKPFAATRIEPC